MSATDRVRAFPWDTLDSTTHADAAALRDARRWARSSADVARLPAVLAELLRTEVTVLVRGAQVDPELRVLDDGVAVLLAPADAATAARSVVVEAEGALVAAALRHLAKRPAAFAFSPASSGPGTAGALAAVLQAALRRSHNGTAFLVLRAGPTTDVMAALASAHEPRVVVSATVLVAHDAFSARIVLPRTTLGAAPSAPWTAASLASLGALPLEVAVVACAFPWPAAEVACLSAGDVLVPGTWRLRRGAAGLAGPVLLAADAADVGFGAELGEDGRLVLRGALEPLGAAEASMSQEVDRDELIDAIGDVPVLVRVEIGEARMSAREWATLGQGDVVALARRVGEPVVIRVGGVRVARGDLVEIDGQVGVRIVERLADAAGASR